MSLNLNNYPNITSVTVFIRNGNNNGPYDNCYWDDLQFKPDDKADPSPKFVKYYYIKDHLGSVRQTLDTLGNIIVAQDYFPYGEVIPGRRYILGTPQEKYKFTGKERDVETNLDYFGARFYNSKIGRWLSVDPIAEKYPGWNPFNYCFDNPLRLVDPNGKGPFDLTFPFELYKLYVIIKINVNSYFNSVAKNNNTTFRFPTLSNGKSINLQNGIAEHIRKNTVGNLKSAVPVLRDVEKAGNIVSTGAKIATLAETGWATEAQPATLTIASTAYGVSIAAGTAASLIEGNFNDAGLNLIDVLSGKAGEYVTGKITGFSPKDAELILNTLGPTIDMVKDAGTTVARDELEKKREKK